jgi:hypothetical protein
MIPQPCKGLLFSQCCSLPAVKPEPKRPLLREIARWICCSGPESGRGRESWMEDSATLRECRYSLTAFNRTDSFVLGKENSS